MLGCLNCGDFAAREVSIGYHGQPLLKCLTCDLIYWSGWAEDFDLTHDLHYAQLEPGYRPNPLTIQRQDEVMAELGRLVLGRRLLDVGCGWGGAVAAAGRAGWIAKGIDLSPVAVDYCQKQGLDCDCTDFFDLDPNAESFHVIMMSELIEHVAHPAEWLNQARRLLASGGLIYVTTPNFNSLGRRLLGNDWNAIGEGHIAYFTVNTLRSAAAAAGLEVLQLETRNPSVVALRRLLLLDRGAPVTRSGQYAAQQRARLAVSNWRSLRSVKWLVNWLLGLTRTGETIVAVLRARVEGAR